MRTHPFKWLGKEPYESQAAARRYHPADMIAFMLNRRRVAAVIPSGEGDEVALFKEGDTVYLLSYNFGLGYIGLSPYDPDRGEFLEGIFLQTDTEIRDTLGDDWEDFSPLTMAKRLSEYLY